MSDKRDLLSTRQLAKRLDRGEQWMLGDAIDTDDAEYRKDRRLIALFRAAGVVCLLALVALTVRAYAAEPHIGVTACEPTIITIYSWQGTRDVDACLLNWSYWADAEGRVMAIDVVTPDNLNMDGIFRNGFEVVTP